MFLVYILILPLPHILKEVTFLNVAYRFPCLLLQIELLVFNLSLGYPVHLPLRQHISNIAEVEALYLALKVS